MPPQQGHWDPPVACGGIVDASIHSVVPPAIGGKAVGWVLRVARLSSTMFAVVEHWPCCTIPHHIWEGEKRKKQHDDVHDYWLKSKPASIKMEFLSLILF